MDNPEYMRMKEYFRRFRHEELQEDHILKFIVKNPIYLIKHLKLT